MSGKGRICKQNSKKLADDRRRQKCTKTCDFGVPWRWGSISPLRCLKHVSGKVGAAAARITGRAVPPAKSHRNNPPPPKEREKTSVAPVDSQRAEAIHDCINFINSSSSLPRSNSVAR